MQKEILLTQQDVKLAFEQSETMLTSYLQRQLSSKRISPGNANAQIYSLRQGRALVMLIADMGLTPQIVMDWMELEMKTCEKLAKEKELLMDTVVR